MFFGVRTGGATRPPGGRSILSPGMTGPATQAVALPLVKCLVDVSVVVERLGAETGQREVFDEVRDAGHVQRFVGGAHPELERRPDPSRDLGLENGDAAEVPALRSRPRGGAHQGGDVTTPRRESTLALRSRPDGRNRRHDAPRVAESLNSYLRRRSSAWLEQRSFKPMVRGSSPRAGTARPVQVRLTGPKRPSADGSQTFG